MTSVGRKLTLNFSKGRLAKKKADRVQDEFDLHDRRASLATNPSKSSSMTNLHVASAEPVLDHKDILELTQFVRNFTEALYKLKEVFNFSNKTAVSGEEVRVQAHDKLGELLCQLGAMKKYPATLTSQVLMAAHDVITLIKRSTYEDVMSDSVEILDCVDRLALAFSTSVSEFLMGDMDSTSRLSKSRSYDNLLLDQDHSFGEQSVHEKSQTSLTGAEVDKSLLSIDQGVDISLNRAKLWSKYAKDIINYIDKRASMEVDYAKSMSKLANSVQQTITEDSFLPFQSIYVTALNHDINLASKSQATFHLVQAQKFVDPLSARRAEHEKLRKQLKDTWGKEVRRMHEAVANLKKSRTLYVTRQQEYDKAREVTQKAETDSLSQSSGAAKMEKKRKLEEDAMHKAMEAETTYKSCVVEANTRQNELEKVKRDILTQTRELILESDKIMKTVTVGYFQLMQAATAPVPAQFQELCEISERYDPGSQYAEFVRRMPVPSTAPTIPEPYVFEPYDTSVRHYEMRKPSIQSSGSGSDIQAYGEDSPMHHSHLLRVKGRGGGGDDGDTDSLSGSSSKSTSPTSSPLPHHKKQGKDSNYTDYTDGGMCGISTHKKCLENLAYQCGHKQALQDRRMTTFGVDFCAHVREMHTEVPYIITKCTEEIEARGLDLKGIYRVSGVKSKVEALCQIFECQTQEVDLSEQNPHVISNVLKLYLRQLPEPLLTFRLYPLVIQLAKDEQSGSLGIEEVVHKLTDLITSLPRPIITTLGVLMGHLAKVKDCEAENQMSASNLGIVFGPTLLRPSDGASSLNSLIETPHQTRIVELLILHRQVIFKDSERKETKESKEKDGASVESLSVTTSGDGGTSPVSPGTDKWSVPEIQESLLDELVRVEPRFQQARPSNTDPAVAEGMVNLPGSVDTGNQPSEQEPPDTLQEHAYNTEGVDVENLPEPILPDETDTPHAQCYPDTSRIVNIDKRLDPALMSDSLETSLQHTSPSHNKEKPSDKKTETFANTHETASRSKSWDSTLSANHNRAYRSSANQNTKPAIMVYSSEQAEDAVDGPLSQSHFDNGSLSQSNFDNGSLSQSHGFNSTSSASASHAHSFHHKDCTSGQRGDDMKPESNSHHHHQPSSRLTLSSQMLRPNLRFYSPQSGSSTNHHSSLVAPLVLTQPRVYSPQSQRKHPPEVQRRHSLTSEMTTLVDTKPTTSLFYSPPESLSKTLPIEPGSPSLRLLAGTSDKVAKLLSSGRDVSRLSPRASPNISPNVSPYVSPKDSPMGSPSTHRKQTGSPLQHRKQGSGSAMPLVSNRKPRFV